MITTLRVSCQALSNVPNCWSVVENVVNFLSQNDCSRMPRNKTMPKDPGRNPESSHIASVHSDSRLMNPAADLRVSAGNPVPRLDRIGEIGTSFPLMGKVFIALRHSRFQATYFDDLPAHSLHRSTSQRSVGA